jgi:hypothetical protein
MMSVRLRRRPYTTSPVTLVDLRVVKEFQESVVEIIRALDPVAAHRILERLKGRKALRPSGDLPILTREGPDGVVV